MDDDEIQENIKGGCPDCGSAEAGLHFCDDCGCDLTASECKEYGGLCFQCMRLIATA